MEVDKKIKRYCKYKNCPNPKRALPPIGNSRANGNGCNDYDNRPYHKACWKKIREFANAEKAMKEMQRVFGTDLESDDD